MTVDGGDGVQAPPGVRRSWSQEAPPAVLGRDGYMGSDEFSLLQFPSMCTETCEALRPRVSISLPLTAVQSRGSARKSRSGAHGPVCMPGVRGSNAFIMSVCSEPHRHTMHETWKELKAHRKKKDYTAYRSHWQRRVLTAAAAATDNQEDDEEGDGTKHQHSTDSRAHNNDDTSSASTTTAIVARLSCLRRGSHIS